MVLAFAARGAPSRGRVLTSFLAKISCLNSCLVSSGGRRSINAPKGARGFSQSVSRYSLHVAAGTDPKKDENGRGLVASGDAAVGGEEKVGPEHAVISTFDLFSIGGVFSLLG